MLRSCANRRVFWIAAVAITGLFPGLADAQSVRMSNRNDTAILEDDGNPTNGISLLRSLNGTFSTRRITHTGDLYVSMLAGNDTLTVEGSLDDAFVGRLILRGNGGDTAVSVRGLQSTGLVCTANGDLDLSMTSTQVDGNVYIADQAGFADISAIAVDVTGNITIRSTDGGSRIRLGTNSVGVRLNGNLNIRNSGFGDDTISVLFSNIDGSTVMNTGSGDCDFSTIFSTYRGKQTLISGGGFNDTLIGDCLFDNGFSIRTGDGDSSTIVATSTIFVGGEFVTGSGFDDYRIFSAFTPSLTLNDQADLSGAGSSIVVRAVGHPVPLDIKQLSILGPNTNLTVDGTSPGAIDRLVVDNVGSSVTDISGGVFIGEVNLKSVGSGWKTLRVESDRVTNLLVNNQGAPGAYSGSTTDVTNANIRGNVSIRSNGNNGRDYIRFTGSVVEGNTYIAPSGSNDTIKFFDTMTEGRLRVRGGGGYDVFEYNAGFVPLGSVVIDDDVELQLFVQ